MCIYVVYIFISSLLLDSCNKFPFSPLLLECMLWILRILFKFFSCCLLYVRCFFLLSCEFFVLFHRFILYYCQQPAFLVWFCSSSWFWWLLILPACHSSNRIQLTLNVLLSVRLAPSMYHPNNRKNKTNFYIPFSYTLTLDVETRSSPKPP